jgi:hypothetical protein
MEFTAPSYTLFFGDNNEHKEHVLDFVMRNLSYLKMRSGCDVINFFNREDILQAIAIGLEKELFDGRYCATFISDIDRVSTEGLGIELHPPFDEMVKKRIKRVEL